MIRASGLYGRAVIDLDTAECIGQIDELIVDPYAPCVAGYVVAGRATLMGRKRISLPMEMVEAVGPDALTIRMVGQRIETAPHLDSLPRLSELTGRKMVSFGGKLLGVVHDALIDERSGRIVGYPLDQSRPADWLESLFGFGSRREGPVYVRADAPLRVGARIIVVPDDAIASAGDLDRAVPSDTAINMARDRGDVAREMVASAPVHDGHATGTSFDAWAPPAPEDGATQHDHAPDDARSDDAGSDVDHDGDTGPLSETAGRGRPNRRPQAVKMH